VANLTYFGLYSLQHRGQESAGIAVFNQGKVRLHKDMGLVSQVFDQDVLARMPGHLAVGHNRYSTTGSSRVCNAQPVVLMTRLGPFALAHNGNLVNAAELRQRVDDGQAEFTSTTDSELIALAIQQALGGPVIWAASWQAEGENERYGVSRSTNGGLTWESYLDGERAHNFGFNGDDDIAFDFDDFAAGFVGDARAPFGLMTQITHIANNQRGVLARLKRDVRRMTAPDESSDSAVLPLPSVAALR